MLDWFTSFGDTEIGDGRRVYFSKRWSHQKQDVVSGGLSSLLSLCTVAKASKTSIPYLYSSHYTSNSSQKEVLLLDHGNLYNISMFCLYVKHVTNHIYLVILCMPHSHSHSSSYAPSPSPNFHLLLLILLFLCHLFILLFLRNLRRVMGEASQILNIQPYCRLQRNQR